jgi:type I restriction enzyme S subunit
MSKRLENTLVPEYRFPEFENSGSWGYIYGNEIFDTISNKNHNSDLPILAITQDQGAIPRDLIDYHVSVSDKSIESYKVVEQGDFIISLRSFQGGIEFSNYLGLCSPAYIILRNKLEIANDFYRLYFKSSPFIQDLNKNLEGIRDGKMVSYKHFSEILLPFPKPAEQQKIASCLSSLDDLIEAENQKLAALQDHKNGMMQQLFPAKGKKVPQLRFEEFEDSGDWVEKTLSDVCEMKAGTFVNASEIKDEQTENLFPCYGGNGLRGFTVSFTHTGNYSLIGRQGALCGNITFVSGKFHATEHAVVATQKKGINTSWLFYLLNELNLNQFATGQAQPGLSVQNLEKIETLITTTPKEQEKIANCLSSIDDLITQQSEKINGLKAHKKGLMQGLFPKSSNT